MKKDNFRSKFEGNNFPDTGNIKITIETFVKTLYSKPVITYITI